MSWFDDLSFRWRALRLRHRQEMEMSEELQFHLEMETEALMRQGLERKQAERAARIALGGLPGIEEACRDAWGTRWLINRGKDLQGALRRLKAEPRFSLVVVLSLALGIGGVAVIFSMLDAVILRPLPFGGLERIVSFEEITPAGDLFSTSDANMIDFEAQCQSVESLAGILFPEPRPSLGRGDSRIALSAFGVTPKFFDVLGVEAHLGRTFSPDEGTPGSTPRVLVLDYGAWQRLFGADPSIVGGDVDLDGEAWTVIGVLPEEFRYGSYRPEVYLPYIPNPSFPRGDHRLNALARLAPGVSLAAAQAEASAVAERLAAEYPETNADWKVFLQPIEDYLLGPELRRRHFMLFGAVGLLLLLACVNVSCLLLAQLQDRRREIQLRRVLGASRSRVLAQLLTESMLLGGLGAVGGWLLAKIAVPWVRALDVPVPRLDQMNVDFRVTALIVGLTVVVGGVLGLASAWRIASTEEATALQGRAQGDDPRSLRVRSALVSLEVALATMLAVGAGLLMQSFKTLQEADPGFNMRQRVYLAEIDLPSERYAESTPATVNFYNGLMERVASLPGVEAAGVTVVSPFRGPQPSNNVGTETMTEQESFVPIRWRSVSPGLFEALGIPVLQGEIFATGAPRAKVMISRQLADRLWPGENPIGRSLRWIGPKGPLIEVIGVVGEVQDLNWGAAPEPTVYLPQDFMGWPNMVLAVRSALPPESLAESLRSVLRDLDPLLALPTLSTLDEHRRGALAQPLLSLRLMGLFSLLAILLAAVGISGIVAYSVSRRRREMGLRAALGAQPGQLLGLTLHGSLRLLASGLVLGLLGTLALAGTLRTLLYETSPFEPSVFATALVALALIGLGASWFPAQRVLREDPVHALREE